MDDVDALLAAAQGQLNSSLSNRDYGAALRSLERLKAAILGAEDVSASEVEEETLQYRRRATGPRPTTRRARAARCGPSRLYLYNRTHQ